MCLHLHWLSIKSFLRRWRQWRQKNKILQSSVRAYTRVWTTREEVRRCDEKSLHRDGSVVRSTYLRGRFFYLWDRKNYLWGKWVFFVGCSLLWHPLCLSLPLFSAISPLFIPRVARYTPSSQRQADEKMKQIWYQFIPDAHLNKVKITPSWLFLRLRWLYTKEEAKIKSSHIAWNEIGELSFNPNSG